MTGAPKQRSVKILEQNIELEKRGFYAGCAGFISLSGHSVLNVVIRTAIINEQGEY